jgi:hypothetical protein
MSRRVSALVAALVASATTTAGATSAFAGASPTVSTGAATSVSPMSAVLTGTVNPQGTSTRYYFEYGLTATYGVTTKSKAAGSASKPTPATSTISGLIPGTAYHYRLVATNRFGTSFGADRTFTTAGHPPAVATTGPAGAVGKFGATLSGTVNPNGQQTTWTFQYGLTTAYGYQTFGGSLKGGSTPQTVTSTLTGLEPGVLFHYRLVALHGPDVISTGLDQTFFTEPNPTPVPRLRAHTTPRHARHRPYVFTTTASISRPSFIPASLACTGNAFVEYLLGSRAVAYNVVAVQPNCTFASTQAFRRIPGRHHRGRKQLKVIAHFDGNGYLASAFSSTQKVTVG